MAENTYPPFLWFNGEIVPWEAATLHATHTIWSGINTVFEGVRAYWNPRTETMHIFRLAEHLRRLKQSLRLIRLDMPHDVSALLEQLPALLIRNEIREDTYIRVVAFPSERRMASRADEEVVNLVVDTAPHPSHLAEDQMRRLMVSSYTRISDAVMSPQIKSIANYRNSDMALQEARLAGYDGPIFLNRHGEVAEGAWSCLFLVRNGVLITPDLQSDILESVTRDTMIRLADEQLGLKVEQRRVGRTELYLADEAFLCGTAAEIQPVAGIDGLTVGDGRVGEVTARLRTTYAGIIRGDGDLYPEWRTSVSTGRAGTASQEA